MKSSNSTWSTSRKLKQTNLSHLLISFEKLNIVIYK